MKKGFHNKGVLKILFLWILFIQGCSIQKLSYRLSKNFDYPEEIKSDDKQKEITKTIENINQTPNIPKKDKKATEVISKGKNEQKVKPKLIKLNQKSKIKNQKFKLQPYRIVIKLVGTNSSAPAEKVTKALREAGIQFEVEKIELFEIQSDTNALPFKR